MGLGSSGSPPAPGGSVDAGEILDPGPQAGQPVSRTTWVRWTCPDKTVAARYRPAAGSDPGGRRRRLPAGRRFVPRRPRRARCRRPCWLVGRAWFQDLDNPRLDRHRADVRAGGYLKPVWKKPRWEGGYAS